MRVTATPFASEMTLSFVFVAALSYGFSVFYWQVQYEHGADSTTPLFTEDSINQRFGGQEGFARTLK